MGKKTTKPTSKKAVKKATKKLDEFAPDQEEGSEEIRDAESEPDPEIAPDGDAEIPEDDSIVDDSEFADSIAESQEMLDHAVEDSDAANIKFWQQNEKFRSLLDPEIVKRIDLAQYDLAKLLNEFFDNMLESEYIDFKVSGIAVRSATKIYHQKIIDVLDEQEKLEEERRRQAIQRSIPTSISQPLRPGRQIATQDDFMVSMRAAIIEVMRKREKQALKNQRQRETGEQGQKRMRTRKMLPEGIRKALLGKERIEETFDRWFQIMHDGVRKSPEKRLSYITDLKPIIEKKDRYGYRFGNVRLFLSILFLRSRGKIDCEQFEEFGDIIITQA